MKYSKLLILLFLFFSSALFAQTDSVEYVISFGNDFVELSQEEEEYVPSEEEKEIQIEGDEARASVMFAQDLLSYVNILKDRDSLIYRFVILQGDNEIIPYPSYNSDGLLKLRKKFDVIYYPDTKKIMYVSEMVLNDNQAWDFIYERIYDENGSLRMFIRQYSTFNSGCAELAFERSEYFYNERNDLVRKTYEIYDAKNNHLNASECWVEREEYQQYMTFFDFSSVYTFPPIDNFEKVSE